MDGMTAFSVLLVLGMLAVCAIGFVFDLINMVFAGIVALIKISVKLLLIGVIVAIGYYGYSFFN